MPTLWAFVSIENTHDAYRDDNCMQNFFDSLRKQTISITNFKKTKTIQRKNNEQQESYEKQNLL